MDRFDVSLVHRLADELEAVAKEMKEHVNSPNELSNELNRIQSIMGSLQDQMETAAKAGSNPEVINNKVR